MRGAKLRADEAAAVQVLAATDPWFAARVGGAKEERLHAASVKALANVTLTAEVIEDGALDFLFLHGTRARSIVEAEAIVAGALRAGGRREREAGARAARAVGGRRARRDLDEERALPRGAVLVRGVIDTWGARVAARADARRADACAAARRRARVVGATGGASRGRWRSSTMRWTRWSGSRQGLPEDRERRGRPAWRSETRRHAPRKTTRAGRACGRRSRLTSESR